MTGAAPVIRSATVPLSPAGSGTHAALPSVLSTPGPDAKVGERPKGQGFAFIIFFFSVYPTPPQTGNCEEHA